MGQARLEPSFREFFKSLNATRVRYLVLGGYAVNFYGYQRYTKDLDVWVAIDGENCARLSKALMEFGGFSARQVSPDRLAEKGAIFVIGREPLRIDVINDPKGVDFDECWVRRMDTEIDGVAVPFIALDDLRLNKLKVARPQDLVDAAKLPDRWPIKPAVRKTRKRRPKV